MAPDTLEKNGKYDLKVDIWSAGITMFKLLLDDYPYKYVEGIQNG
jgi:serine/threonine protein kinase